MLVDEAVVLFVGGHGGVGKVSFYPPPMRGPDGGNGGKGGDLYLQTTSNLTALNKFSASRTWVAESGEAGGGNKKTGRDGKDLIIDVPVGSHVTDCNTKEEMELTSPGQIVLICKGGLGGRGNFELKSSRNTTPKFAQKGLEGQKRQFQISLRFLADFGLIGLPNCGKSSLLNQLTNAQAKVGNYPFTTIEPNLGVLDGKIIADIPGLLEGASKGRGLGIKFLKHIEKVSLLVHCISSESEKPYLDYQIVRDELGRYNQALLSKDEIVLLTKIDLVNIDILNKKLQKLKKINKKTYYVSVYDIRTIEKLKSLLLSSPGVQSSPQA